MKIPFSGITLPLAFLFPDFKTQFQRVIIIFILTAVYIPVTSGNIYYVAKNGNDDNPGTEARPWLTIKKAADTLIAGDIVYVKQGTYIESFRVKNSGSFNKFITFTAYPGDAVTIDGRGQSISFWDGLIQLDGKNYINISGFKFVNSPQAGIHADSSDHIIIEKNYFGNTTLSPIKIGWGYSTNIIIDRNVFDRRDTENWEEMISISNAHTVEVKYNHIMRNGKGEGIDLKDGTTDARIHHNIVENTTAVGIYIDARGYIQNVEVYNNIVHNVQSDGIGMANENFSNGVAILENVSVYNNIVYNNAGSGLKIPVVAYPQYIGTIKDVEAINNVFYKNEEAGIDVGYWDTGYIQNIVIRNNIITQNKMSQILIYTKPIITGIIIDHNLIDGFKDYSHEGSGSNYVEGNPLFVDPAHADFHIQNASPALDKGSPIGAPSVDFDGIPRPQGFGYDIGPFEFHNFTGLSVTATPEYAATSTATPAPTKTIHPPSEAPADTSKSAATPAPKERGFEVVYAIIGLLLHIMLRKCT